MPVSESTTVTAIPQPAACRPLRIPDAMILIAGLAVVLAMGGHLFGWCAYFLYQVCRTVVENRADLWDDPQQLWRFIGDPARQLLSYGFQATAMLVFGMTPIFLILRLKRPRPSWRPLLVQPGMVAALAVVFGFYWVTGLVHILLPGRIDSIRGPWIVVGGTVAAAWVILALIRRWKAEPGWVDRMGRLLGAMAIGAALLGWVMYRI
jgi:hypothetical protein